MQVAIERASQDDAESRAVAAELWAEIDRLYENEPTPITLLTRMGEPGAAFLLARQEGKAVGCAALRPLRSGTAEVKRLYVQPGSRGLGVARAIMHELEQLAPASGFNEIWLETGLRQPAAIRLYESLGYTRIAGFGDYKDDRLSVCYGKRLK